MKRREVLSGIRLVCGKFVARARDLYGLLASSGPSKTPRTTHYIAALVSGQRQAGMPP